ncbi:MAG TPA: sugar phosphate isomerase/epimerase [Pirellulales bacterium]|nr:sugar phosphate isomerase/epimerase [Pirellulales bacterium]
MHDDIRIGTLVKADRDPASYIRQILPYGFESFELTFPTKLAGLDLGAIAADVRRVLDEHGGGAIVSSIGIYGNALVDAEVAQGFAALIDRAEEFGCKLVCGFTGRIVDRPVPESMPAFKQVFAPLAQRAEDRGVRIAFENCDMRGTWEYGDWNIAHAPTAWEMMFNEVPSPALGLEWEPCHQMVSLIDPLPQLRQWIDKVFHVHGKDATVMWDVIRTSGIRGGKQYVHHRTPGFGDTNWNDVITILRLGGYRGSIDIEGWHDPVYRGELEMTGQVRALNYLKECRGGPFVPNPR